MAKRKRLNIISDKSERGPSVMSVGAHLIHRKIDVSESGRQTRDREMDEEKVRIFANR